MWERSEHRPSDWHNRTFSRLVITCSGRVPTPSGMPIPMGSCLLSISANITGRLFQPMAVSGALLIIDEAFPAKPVPGSATPAPGAPPADSVRPFSEFLQ